MKDNTKIRYGLLGLVLVVVFGITATGCATNVAFNRVNLNVDRPPRSQIHNLRHESRGMDREFQNQVERIMGEFLDTRGEELGYYTINFISRAEGSTGGGRVLGFFSGFFLFVPNLIGMPWDISRFRLQVFLNIFDSDGNLVQTFDSTERFTLVRGLYYGYSPTRRSGRIFSELLDEVLRQADRDASLINAMLEAAGPITVENTAAARSRIHGRDFL